MNKYIIFANKGGLACEKRQDGETVGYIETEDQFKNLAHTFIKNGYKIKIKNRDMALVGADGVILLRDCYKIINHRLLRDLAIDIERTMDKKGFTDITKEKTLNKKVNRQKSNEGLPKLIKTGLKIAAGVGAAALLYNAVASQMDKHYSQGVEPTIPAQSEEKEVPPTQKGIPDTPSQNGSQIFNSTVQVAYQMQSDKLHETHDTVTKTNTAQTDTSNTPSDNYEFLNNTTEMPTSNTSKYQESVLPQENVQSAHLEFENNSQTDKALKTKELYMPYFEDCAYRFGLDAKLLLAMATQERGVHSDVKEKDGGLGLMQIQYDVWIDKTVSYLERNPSTGEFEKKTITITDAMLRDVKSNIEVASIILQTYLGISHYNIPVGLQMYNMGDGAMKSILRTYGATCDKTLDELFDSPTDLGWTEYRYLKAGDPKYLEKVNQWSENPTYTVLNLGTMEDVTFAFENENTLGHLI